MNLEKSRIKEEVSGLMGARLSLTVSLIGACRKWERAI